MPSIATGTASRLLLVGNGLVAGGCAGSAFEISADPNGAVDSVSAFIPWLMSLSIGPV